MMVVSATWAQMMNPVHFTSQLKELKGGEGELGIVTIIVHYLETRVLTSD